MRFFLTLAALVGAALAFPPVQTRDNCPPAGYTAISGSWKSLDLPPYGKYAICLEPLQAAAVTGEDIFDFTWNGVFRLTKSTLLVDRKIRLHATYPSRVEWNDVTVTGFSTSQNQIDEGYWGGIRSEGAPSDIMAKYANYQKDKKFGNCGTLNKVTINQVMDAPPAHPLALVNCTYAKLNEVDILKTEDSDDQDCVSLEHSRNLIFTDLSSICENGNGVELVDSEAAFVRSVIFAGQDNGFSLRDGSNITVCDSLVYGNSRDYRLGGTQGDDAPVSAAVAGRTNSVFPEDLVFRARGGILFTLKGCPEKFSSSYPMKMWKEWYTNDGVEN